MKEEDMNGEVKEEEGVKEELVKEEVEEEQEVSSLLLKSMWTKKQMKNRTRKRQGPTH